MLGPRGGGFASSPRTKPGKCQLLGLWLETIALPSSTTPIAGLKAFAAAGAPIAVGAGAGAGAGTGGEEVVGAACAVVRAFSALSALAVADAAFASAASTRFSIARIFWS